MQNQLYFYMLAIRNEFKAITFTTVSKTYKVNKKCVRPLLNTEF